MLGHNDAEQLVVSFVDGAAASTAMAVVPKRLVIALSDGATDFAVGDKFTIALTQNPPAAGAVTADSGNTGNGTGTATLTGTPPAETITLTCIAAASNAGTFKVVGSVSGRHANLTVGVSYTITYQAIAAEDRVVAAIAFADAGSVPTDVTSTITVDDGVITSTSNLATSILLLYWIDRSAG